jgi:hypothetical protein
MTHKGKTSERRTQALATQNMESFAVNQKDLNILFPRTLSKSGTGEIKI